MQHNLVQAPVPVHHVRTTPPAGRHTSVTRIFRLITQLSYHSDDTAVTDIPPSAHVRIHMTPLGQANIVELSGEIDIATATEFWTHLTCVPTSEDVLVDLADVRFMGAAGLTLLLRFRRRLTDPDAPLQLTGVSHMIRTMITMVDLQDVLVCLPTGDQATAGTTSGSGHSS
jgi:anti-anti-sigma factor